MDDAPGALRSPGELAACVAGIDMLLAASLVQPDEAEKQRDVLKVEALAWARGLELRRGSVGEGTSMTRLQRPSVGNEPPSLAAPPPPPAAAERPRPDVEHPKFVLYIRAQDRWLDKDANLELWESKMTASQRRILMTQLLAMPTPLAAVTARRGAAAPATARQQTL